MVLTRVCRGKRLMSGSLRGTHRCCRLTASGSYNSKCINLTGKLYSRVVNAVSRPSNRLPSVSGTAGRGLVKRTCRCIYRTSGLNYGTIYPLRRAVSTFVLRSRLLAPTRHGRLMRVGGGCTQLNGLRYVMSHKIVFRVKELAGPSMGGTVRTCRRTTHLSGRYTTGGLNSLCSNGRRDLPTRQRSGSATTC